MAMKCITWRNTSPPTVSPTRVTLHKTTGAQLEGWNLIDRAIIRFDEGQTLPKFQIHENSTKIYIPQDGKDYAIVNANEMGEMPVNSSLLTVLRSLRIAPYQWRGNEDPKGSHSILKALKFR